MRVNCRRDPQGYCKDKSGHSKDSHTAGTLGTEREGNGVIIDSEGLILTIGYLIVEAETIEVIGPEEQPIRATFVGYDYNTGLGLLRTEKLLSVAPSSWGSPQGLKTGDPILIAGHGGADSAIPGRVLIRKEFAGYWNIFSRTPYTRFRPMPILAERR